MFVSDVASRDSATIERLVRLNWDRTQLAALQKPRAETHARPAHFTHIVAPAARAPPAPPAPPARAHSVDDGTEEAAEAAEAAGGARGAGADEEASRAEEEAELLRRQARLRSERSRRVVENEMRDAETRAALEIKRLSWTLDDIVARARVLLRPVLQDFVAKCVAWDGLDAPLVATVVDAWVSQWSARRAFAELHLRSDLQPALARLVEARQIHRMSGMGAAGAAGAAGPAGAAEGGAAGAAEGGADPCDMSAYLRISKSRAFVDKKGDVLRAFFSLKCGQLSQAQCLLSAMRLCADAPEPSALQAEQQRSEAEQALGMYVQSYLVSLSSWAAMPDTDPAPPFRPPARAKAPSPDPVLDAFVASAHLPVAAAPFACWEADASHHLLFEWQREHDEAQQEISESVPKKDPIKVPGAFMLLRKVHFCSSVRRRAAASVVWSSDAGQFMPARSPLS